MKCPAERAYSRRDCNISLVIIADIKIKNDAVIAIM